MARYIELDAILAEINALLDDKFQCDSYDEATGFQNALTLIKKFLDTLEVKEVDLEKEYEEFVVDDPIFGSFITNDTMGMELAKHFFELGMTVSNKAQKGEKV